MYRVVALAFFLVIGLLTVGCGSDSTATTAPGRAGVLDVPATPAPIPPAAPVAAAPLADSQPVMYSAAPSTPAPISNKTYTVKKGDTLFSIAKSSYGTGRDWQKIAAANPGIEPSKLKVGQQLVIP